MKILTILGTRPEIIRLSRVIPRLDEVCEIHVLVHTGQNYDPTLSANFFTKLGLRDPNYNLGATGSFGQQLSIILPAVEDILVQEKPDRVLVLGDTNSSLAAIVAARLSIPVYHMEAGNRSYSPHSPEEVNRRLVDHCSSVLLPYTERSRQNLLAEGIRSDRIFVTGNPIKEVLDYYRNKITASKAHGRFGLGLNQYFLVTLHRAENVDVKNRLDSFLDAFTQLAQEYSMPVVVSTHPHTRQRLEQEHSKTKVDPRLQFLDPFGFFDFIHLQRHAFCVLSDSGTVQEESCLLQVPSVCLRDHTERPECVEAGASVLSGADPEAILRAVKLVTESKASWVPPPEYLRATVAETVVRIVTGHYERGQL